MAGCRYGLLGPTQRDFCHVDHVRLPISSGFLLSVYQEVS